MKTFIELAECLARILPKITLYGRLFKYSYVGRLLFLMFSTNLLFAIKRDVYFQGNRPDYFVGFRSLRSSTSGRWLEKSGKHVGPNFSLKPNTKARSLQFCKTEIKADIGGKKKRNKRRVYCLLVNGETSASTQNWSSRERVKDSFTRLIHSCQCHFIHIYVYMYVCIYNFL